MKKFEINKEVFDTFDLALEFALNILGMSEEEAEQRIHEIDVEEESLEEAEERFLEELGELPTEEFDEGEEEGEVLDSIELEKRLQEEHGRIILEAYRDGKISDENRGEQLKAHVLKEAMRQSVQRNLNDIDKELLTSEKKTLRERYEELISQGICPASDCGIHYTKLTSEGIPETHQTSEDRTFERRKREIISEHLRKVHPKLYEVLSKWGIITRVVGEPRPLEDEPVMPESRIARTPNPEACSRDLEKLSKEQLAQEIVKDENLTKQFLAKAFADWDKKRRES